MFLVTKGTLRDAQHSVRQVLRLGAVTPVCTQALRLEPHHVISNHTGLPLQLMHFQPDSMQETYRRKAGGAVEVGGSTTPSGLPRAPPAGPSGQPGLKGAVHEPDVDWTSVLDLPAGATSLGRCLCCMVIVCWAGGPAQSQCGSN